MLALQALCLFDSLGQEFEEQLGAFLQDPHVHADLGLDSCPDASTLSFARELALGAWRQRQRYDELLSETATAWSIARMPPVDRNILRLGLHELLEHPETPPEVTINEAVDLAHHLADKDSPGFVNGVLDAARRRLGIADTRGAEPPIPPANQPAGEGEPARPT